MMSQLRARSPAKLILSGEHAVVYGKPAIAMAIDRYAESTVMSSLSSAILFNCLNLQYARSFTLHALETLKKRIQNKYYAFLEGRCSIKDVLKRPFELLQYTVTHLLETWNIPLSHGLEIQAASNIPMGCGMGSSAALVMSTLYALSNFLKLEIDPMRYLSLGLEAENLQHGRSSGLDLRLAMSGGCFKFQEGQISKRILPAIPMFIVQTGMPITTTGQCVSAVRKHFQTSFIGEDFAGITELFDEALQAGDILKLQECIRQNHQLLVKIGVVPAKVQSFIHAIEKEGGAAKICGAGAVKGDKSGVVLVVGEKHLSSIAHDYGYEMQLVRGDFYGTHII